MLGENVVWVQAWNWRAMPTGKVSSIPMRSSGDSSGSVISAG